MQSHFNKCSHTFGLKESCMHMHLIIQIAWLICTRECYSHLLGKSIHAFWLFIVLSGSRSIEEPLLLTVSMFLKGCCAESLCFHLNPAWVNEIERETRARECFSSLLLSDRCTWRIFSRSICSLQTGCQKPAGFIEKTCRRTQKTWIVTCFECHI